MLPPSNVHVSLNIYVDRLLQFCAICKCDSYPNYGSVTDVDVGLPTPPSIWIPDVYRSVEEGDDEFKSTLQIRPWKKRRNITSG